MLTNSNLTLGVNIIYIILIVIVIAETDSTNYLPFDIYWDLVITVHQRAFLKRLRMSELRFAMI
jgi:hypothetical protein